MLRSLPGPGSSCPHAFPQRVSLWAALACTGPAWAVSCVSGEAELESTGDKDLHSQPAFII